MCPWLRNSLIRWCAIHLLHFKILPMGQVQENYIWVLPLIYLTIPLLLNFWIVYYVLNKHF